MALTPNYGMTIPVSTDIVNLLTQCYPNFIILDTDLKAVSDAAITVATETKTGTVHNLVRSDPDRNVLTFTATSNFVYGDTFTVDGNAVTVVTPSGASVPGGAFVINSNVFGIVDGAKLTLLVSGGAADANDVSYDNTGSGLTGSNVQDVIDEIAGELPIYATAILTAGATSITINDANIMANSLLTIYNNLDVDYDAIASGAGYVTLTYEAQLTNMTIVVEIKNM